MVQKIGMYIVYDGEIAIAADEILRKTYKKEQCKKRGTDKDGHGNEGRERCA